MWQAVRLALGTASALGLARFAYGLLLPAMRDDLRWTLAEAGAMSAANGLGYLLGALVTAAVVRRSGVTAAFRRGMAGTAVALAATAISDDFAVLLVVRAAAGAAGAVVFIAGGVIASRIATRVGSGTPITVYFAGAGLGIAFGGVAIPLLGDGWRAAWVVLGVAAGVAALASWTAARADGEAPAATAGRARVRPLWRVASAYALFALGYITYITFLSAYLVERRAPTWQVVLTWAALGLAVVATPVLWSRPIAAWPGARAPATLLGVLGGGAALALVAPTPLVILGSAIVYGATFMGVPAAVTALIRDAVPAADLTATLAAFTTLFAAGQTAGPWLAGLVADRTSTDATLAWTAVLCALAAVIAVSPRRRRSARRAPRPRPAAPARPRRGS
ncbi:YbfB/YjiJ family MFS transporter [Saccharothrix texasensis]|uniref:Putative MFS family arabinose efflux permease n=1 Tax=Saccharothrix texasensis TaxID=103734 RepID=A0A3N1HJ10_9PSEU|nr:YbfB/YjiJ family MFS transporter [Saccharothrix texasensis]ROP42431.1 putative MFS family arabinose efflux permease [Saccharothrix texasensis]